MSRRRQCHGEGAGGGCFHLDAVGAQPSDASLVGSATEPVGSKKKAHLARSEGGHKIVDPCDNRGVGRRGIYRGAGMNGRRNDPGLREQSPICVNVTPFRGVGMRPFTSTGEERSMLTLRHWVLVIGGAGLFAGLPLSDALACDDDRFPCPIVSETPAQETASPARPAPRKKVSQPARQDEKAHATPRAAARTKASKPVVQEQVADSIPQKAAEAVPAMEASSLADQSANEEGQNESRLATAATAWPILQDTDGAGANSSEANSVDATEAAKATTVQLVVSNEVMN